MTRKTAISFLRVVSMIGIYGGLLMPLVFIPVVIFPFVFSKLIAFQILIGLTFPAYLLLAWMEPAYRPRKHLLYGAIGAYFVAVLLSVIFAIDPYRAWWGNQERMNGLFSLLHFLAWITMAIGVLKTWDQWKRLLQFEVVLSLVMSCVIFLQKPFPKLLLFEVQPGARMGGLLDNPIYMGAYQIFNLAFLAMLWVKTKSWSMRGWYAVVAVCDIIAFALAQSRGPLVGLGVGIIAFAFFFGLITKNRRARFTVLGLVIALFALYGALFAFRNTALVQGMPWMSRFLQLNADQSRFNAWNIAWQGFKERPLVGWGFDNFHILYNVKYNPQALRYGLYQTWFDRAHNTVFDVLAMTGILGLLTFLGIFIALYASLWRAYRKRWLDGPFLAILAALPLAYLVQNLLVFDHPAAFSMSFLLYGLVIVATRPGFMVPEEEKKEETKKVHGFSWSIFVALYLVALVLVWKASVLPFQASRLAIQSNNYFSSGMIGQALQAGLAAYAIPTPYLDDQVFLFVRNTVGVMGQQGFSTLKSRDQVLQLAKDLIADELRRHPQNTNDVYLAARFYQGLARFEPTAASRAETLYKQAIATSPKRQQTMYGLADLYGSQGRLKEAIAIQKQVSELDSELGQGFWIYGLTLMYQTADKATGSQQVIKSQNVSFPYVLTDVRELSSLAEAYITAKDQKGAAHLLDVYPTIATSTSQIQNYVDLAKMLDKAGWKELRDKTLDYASQAISPAVRSVYASGGTFQPDNAQTTLFSGDSKKVVATTTHTTGAGPRK
jgi:O-antigen ligase/tetratricopeptide (TPR) repeat protein